ncbi:MAG: restriction endonuclease subunit S [Planctomycetes bacterium]|nr:restriction endonuclease subunit S [Planctomycetota bacterium]
MPFRVNRDDQIPTSEIKPFGTFPVVDQGQAFLAGFTDESSKVVRDGLPVIVFGDHTRCFKFVDFPFALGADGTKVVKADPARFDAKFFYFACLNLKLPSRGYNRHFKLLKESTINFPVELLEQRRIAGVLGLVQHAIAQQERLAELTAELKQALMHKLFTEGTRGERQKATEIGPVPESWEAEPLGACCDVQTGLAKGRRLNPEEALDVPYLRVANVQDGYLDLSEIKTVQVRERDLQRFGLRRGDVLMTEGGDLDKLGRGFIWDGQIEPCLHQNHVFAVRPHKDKLTSEYLAYLVQSPYAKAYFLSVAHKTTNLACINTSKLKRLPVLLPGHDEQHQIVESLSTVDAKVRNHRKQAETLSQLFSTLLHKLLTAEIRVDSLDVAVLGIEADEIEIEEALT